MRTSSSRPSSRHAARVSALVAIALCAFAPIAVSAAGAPSGSTPRGAVGDALRSWIDANGDAGVELEGVYLGEHDGVAAAYRAGGAARRDVGVFAASGGLDAGEAYVSVPWSLVLSAETVGARRPALGALLTQLRAEYGADEKSALMLALLHERFASPEDSPWRDYLAALPAPGDDDGFDATVRWSPASLRELRGSLVLDDAIADQARVRAVHKGFTARVFEANHAGASPFPPRAATLAATEWAWSIVHSRASRVPGKGLAIVPLADMINDADAVELEARARARAFRVSEKDSENEKDFVVYDATHDRAAVYAKRDYRAGEEVTERYGGWSDADTLLSAGYVRGVRDGVSEADGEVSVSCVAVSLGAELFELSPEPERAREDARVVHDALKDHGFEVPWRACLSPAMRGSRDAKRVAKWASIVAENNPEGDANANATAAALSGEEKDAERRRRRARRRRAPARAGPPAGPLPDLPRAGRGRTAHVPRAAGAGCAADAGAGGGGGGGRGDDERRRSRRSRRRETFARRRAARGFGDGAARAREARARRDACEPRRRCGGGHLCVGGCEFIADAGRKRKRRKL